MKTKNSVNLLPKTTERCWALLREGCNILTRTSEECGSCRCPFYKPVDCGDWIRVEDEEGITLIPPEEYYPAATKNGIKGDLRPAVWKITRVRS